MNVRMRRGWMRLGVVLSVAWIVVVVVFTGYQYRETRFDLLSSIGSPQHSGDGWEIIGKQVLLFECSVNSMKVSCHPRADNLALLAIGPIALTWVFAYLFAVSVAWVRAGFAEDR